MNKYFKLIFRNKRNYHKKLFFSINILLVTVSVIFSGEAILFTKSVISSKSDNNKSNIILTIESDEDIYGIQFDILYDTSELILAEDAIISKVAGAQIYSSIVENGIARVIMFGVSGEKLIGVTADSVADFISINFHQQGKFRGISVVELLNITLAGKVGIEIDLNSSSVDAFEVSFIKPQNTYLVKNIPDPFNSITNIEYAISEAGMVSLIIFDLDGAVVKTLVNSHQEENYYNIIWNGLNYNGDEVASGKYIVKIATLGFSETITMTLLNK